MCVSYRFLAIGDSYMTIAHSWGTVIGWFMNMYDASTRRKSRHVRFRTRRRTLTRPVRKLTLKTIMFDLARVSARRSDKAHIGAKQRIFNRIVQTLPFCVIK